MTLDALTKYRPVSITKSNTTVFNPPLIGIIVTADGTLTVKNIVGDSVAIEVPVVASGGAFPCTLWLGEIVQVMDTGTDLENAEMTGLQKV